MGSESANLLDAPRDFVKDGINFVNRCQKPTRKEYERILKAVAYGFAVMGALGFVVKLVGGAQN